jgi:hypothetical protein
MISLFFALLLAQEKCIVEGTVVNALTKEPLRKAHVVLEEGNTSYAATSNAEGKFRFEGIEPGEYELQAQRQGFLDADDEPFFMLAAGEHLKDLVMEMTPAGAIAGHVVDDDGDPVPSLTVNAALTIHINGRANVLGREGGFTDNEGYFLISELPPGRYYLSAEPSYNPQKAISRPGHPGVEEEFIRTDDMVPRDVTPGSALRNVVIRIHKSATYRIRGRIANPPKDNPGVLLILSDGIHRANDPRASGHDGEFEFAGIAPGNYVLLIDSAGLYCHMPITVVDHNIEGLVAELAPGPNIEGTIKMEGDGHFERPPDLQLIGNFRSTPIRAKEDGTFEWTNLAPREYVLLYRAPNGYYVKSVLFNQQPVKRFVIDLTSGAGGKLDIVVAPNAASLAILVEGGKPARVTLSSESGFETWNADPNATTTLGYLAPGDYRIQAWETVDSKVLEIPEFRARFDAQKITLAEGSHENIEVKLIPKSASDAEIAKLQ